MKELLCDVKQRSPHLFGVFIVNFEQNLYIALLYPLLTLNR